MRVISEESQTRAKQLLKESLASQYQALNQGGIYVQSRVPGYGYRVDNQAHVTLITDSYGLVSLCVAPIEELPKADRILTLIRHLQANELGLVKKAGFSNRGILRNHLLQELKRAQRPS